VHDFLNWVPSLQVLSLSVNLSLNAAKDLRDVCLGAGGNLSSSVRFLPKPLGRGKIRGEQ